MTKDKAQKALPTLTGTVTDRHGDMHQIEDFLCELNGLVQTLHAAQIGVEELCGEEASSFHLVSLILWRVQALNKSARGE